MSLEGWHPSPSCFVRACNEMTYFRTDTCYANHVPSPLLLVYPSALFVGVQAACTATATMRNFSVA